MKKRMKSFKASTVVLASLSLFAAACTTNPNQVTKQSVQKMNQAVQNPSQVSRQSVQKMNQGAHNLASRTGLTDNRTGTVHERIEIADRAATNIVKVKGVRAANVLVTRHNAYVAAALVDNRQKMTGDVEKNIANQVRKADPRIQHVYVSTNPQFVERVSGYVRDVRQGRPVTGFAQEFSEMVARIFPNAK